MKDSAMNETGNNIKRKYYIKMAISWILVIAWAMVIFYLSSRTAVQSTVQSRKVISVFSFLLNFGVFDEETLTNIDGIVRECAHGVEYFILGALLFNALYICLNFRKQEEKLLFAETGIDCSDRFRALNCIICSLVIATLYALSDEIHQIYVPGRSCQLLDLIIDISGSLLGILLIWVFYFIREKRKERRLSLRSHRVI